MRIYLVALAMFMAAGSAHAADANHPDIQGLWLTTDFPALQLHAGEKATLPLTLYNYGLAPQRTNLTISDTPADWKPEIDGAGKPVSAAFVNHDGNATFSLKLDIPASAKPGPYKIVIQAKGDNAGSDLPITIDLTPPLAAKLTATPKLPILKGTPRSAFDFSVSVKNDSDTDMLVNLGSQAPRGFQVTFKEGYGTQELTSLPLKASESKDVAVSVKPNPDVAAGRYPVAVEFNGEKAKVGTRLTLDIAGQPQVTLSGIDDRLSGQAYAGKEKSFPLVLRNSGSAPAHGLSLSASPPSGWKVTFDPKKVDTLDANGERKVTALVTPNPKAINGDYVVTMSASGDGVSENASYRITVLTSTLWGVAGVGVIGIAALVLVGAVGRFGRR